MLKDGASHSYISEVGYKGFRTVAYVGIPVPNGPSVARDGQGRNMLGLPRRRTHEALSLEDRKESEDYMNEEWNL